MEKPFLTIDQQVVLLESRGVKTSESTGSRLLRDGYYAIVNGYKNPFIDDKATALAGDDRYVDGTTFDSLYALFCFDRELRALTFRYLIKAEATARTAISYCFSREHQNIDDYLLQTNYCSKEEFESYGKSNEEYAGELSGLTSLLRRRQKNSTSAFTAHYRTKYGFVPLWVLVNDLTFGNLEHFFNLMKPAEQKAVCKAIAESTGRLGDKSLGYFGADKARICLEVLVKFRNICAHDERLYCARVGGRKDVDYGKMVWMLERFLTQREFFTFLDSLLLLLEKEQRESTAIGHVLNGLGFKELATEIERRFGERQR